MTGPENSDNPPSPAGTVGSFALGEPTGTGAFSSVWSGYHVGRGVPVAIKVMRPATAETYAERARMFQREVLHLSRLDHPAIVRVLGFGVIPKGLHGTDEHPLTPGVPYLALERATGGTLEWRRAPLEWEDLRNILLAILDALGHAHARGVLHLDLKPANVLVCGPDDSRPGIKLSDWGFSQVIDDRRDRAVSDPLIGTPRFMPPEQFAGRWRDYGPWTDLYALGALAWSLTTGRPVFEGGFSEVFRGHTSDMPGALKSRRPVPPGLESWLLNLLRKDPAERFAHAADASAALRALDGDTSVTPWSIYSGEHDVNDFLDDLSWIDDQELGSLDDADLGLLIAGTEDARSAHDEAGIFIVDGDGTDELIVEPEPGDRTSPALGDAWPRPRLPLDFPGARRTPRLPVEPSLFGLRQPRLCGRQQEAQALWELLRQAVAGQVPAAALVEGPVGSGKTRLLQELATFAYAVGGVTVVRIGGIPIRDTMRTLLRIHGLGTDAAVREGEARLRAFGMLAAPARELAVGTVEARPIDGAYLDLVVRFIAALGRLRPVLVLLDDVDRSRDALSLTARLQARAPSRVCVVATARRNEIASAIGSALRALEQRVQLRVLLTRLPLREQEALVNDLICLTPGLAGRVARQTQGNPGLAVDMVGHWVRGNFLTVERGSYSVNREGLALLTGRAGRRFRKVRRSSDSLPTQPVSRPTTVDHTGAVKPRQPAPAPRRIKTPSQED